MRDIKEYTAVPTSVLFNGTKFVNLNVEPESNYYDRSEFSGYEMREASDLGCRLMVYFYFEGCYEGTGKAVWTDGSMWHQKDLSHCSCYGPLDGISKVGGLESLDEIAAFSKNDDDMLFLISEAKRFEREFCPPRGHK